MKSLFVLALLVAAGCASSGHNSVTLASPTSDSDRAALLDRVKSLEGTWESTSPEGTHVASVFSVSSAGSVVREVMLPGTPEEMTNMYSMDGSTLLMTHYCAMGNQPRMRATADPSSNSIHFAFDGVSNLQQAHDGYMGSMTLTIVDKDHVKTAWEYYQNDKEPEVSVFELTRSK